MEKLKMKILNFKKGIAISFFILIAIVPVSFIKADATTEVNIADPGFKLTICDGPEYLSHINPKTNNYDPNYKEPNFVACDFKGIMLQAQKLINVALAFGVLIAIFGFIWAGVLYIKGSKGDIDKAHKIFPRVVWGFVIMLSAWFIVYQLLAWVTGNNAFGVLLGN